MVKYNIFHNSRMMNDQLSKLKVTAYRISVAFIDCVEYNSVRTCWHDYGKINLWSHIFHFSYE